MNKDYANLIKNIIKNFDKKNIRISYSFQKEYCKITFVDNKLTIKGNLIDVYFAISYYFLGVNLMDYYYNK